MNKDNLLVWWTAEEHCIFKPFKCNYTKLPDYMWQEYCNRVGRAGHGRLWVPNKVLNKIPIESVDAEYESQLWEDHRRLEQCAGIVFFKEDVQAVQLCPGHITNLNLENIKINK